MTESPVGSTSIQVTNQRQVLSTYLLCAALLFSLSLSTTYLNIPFPFYFGYPFFHLLISMMFGGWAAAIVYTALFCVWCAPVFTGEDKVPLRSLYLLLGMTMLTAVNFITNWELGLSYEGENRLKLLALVNGAIISTLLAMWVWARKRGGLALYFAFHPLIFAYGILGFFPYLGELP